MTSDLDERGLETAAFQVFAKANAGNLRPETITSLWPSQHHPHWSGLAEAAIRAYLSVSPPPVMGKVRGLAWPDTPLKRGQRVKSAGGIFSYTIAFYGGDVGDPIYRWAREQGAWSTFYATFAEAKAAAQADYEARILTALSPAPQAEVPEGWRTIQSAPEDEAVLLCTTGGHVGEALMLRDEDTGEQKWTWAAGPVSKFHTPLGWQPLPSAIDTPAGAE